MGLALAREARKRLLFSGDYCRPEAVDMTGAAHGKLDMLWQVAST